MKNSAQQIQCSQNVTTPSSNPNTRSGLMASIPARSIANLHGLPGKYFNYGVCSRQARLDTALTNGNIPSTTIPCTHPTQRRIHDFFKPSTTEPSTSRASNFNLNPNAPPWAPKLKKSTNEQINTTVLNLFVQNVRGIRTKSHSIYRETSMRDIDIYALTETWLHREISSSEYFDSTFNVFRRDRHEHSSSTARGGGVLIAVKSKLVCDNLPLPNASNIECICVKIILNRSTNAYIYNAYLPPNSSNEVYSAHVNAIKYVHSLCKDSDIVIITGDFNIPKIEWESESDDSNIMLPNFTEVDQQFQFGFIFDMNELGMSQINNVWRKDTANNDRILLHNILDLVFTNDPVNVDVAEASVLVSEEGCHPAALFSFEWNFETVPPDRSSYFNFKRANYDSINEFLQHSNIVNRLSEPNHSLESKVDILMSTLHEAIDLYVPKTERKSYSCPWSTKKLRNLKNIKTKAWKYFQNTNDKSFFERAKAEFDALNMKLYGEYMDRMASTALENSKSFWQHVNKRKKGNMNPKLLHYHETSTVNEQHQSELFAEFFASNFGPPGANASNPVEISPATGLSELFLLDDRFIAENLSKINASKGTGPDGIHPLLLKNCADTLSIPLALIFNESLILGRFPSQWKSYSVRPIHKKGPRSDIENYRCIAKLPTIAKFFEKLITFKLTKLVEHRIIPQQHGFMKRRSTANNLMEFVHYVFKNKGQVDVLYTDFRKAFDKVNHRILLRKLNELGLPLNLIHWIRSYLSDRRQFVDYNGNYSAEFIVNSGVPQGSHLGPLLFLIFINDIVEKMGVDVFVSLFADDLKIAVAINSPDDVHKLQTAINELEKWCNENDLHLNLEKCSILSVSNKREIIRADYRYGDYTFKRVNEQKDLGVIIDSKMNFMAHKSAIISKAASALGFVKRFCYNVNNTRTLKTLYYALVQSILEYCCVVWLPHAQNWIDQIEQIQRQFTMFVMREYPSAANDFSITSYPDRLQLLEMTSLHRRRTNTAVQYLYDLINDHIHCPRLKSEITINENTRNLRVTSVELFKVKDRMLQMTTSAPVTQICKLANKVKDTFSLSTNRTNFRNNLKAKTDDVFL